VVKNKVAPPFRTVEFDILYGEGICSVGDLIDNAVDMGIVDKMGAWYSYGDERLGQGREKVRQLLKEDEELRARIEAKVRAVAFGEDGEDGEDSEDGEGADGTTAPVATA
jgi:recombination protein RecA